MLMVTTTVGMLYGILGNTTNLRPAVTLDGILMVGTAGLEEGLVGTATSGDDTDLGTDVGGDSLLATRGEAKAGGALLIVVRNDNSETAGATGEGTTVTDAGLDVADDGTLGDGPEGQDIADIESCLLTAVNELSGVHALGGDEELSVTLVAVGVKELDLGDRSATTGIVDDLLDNSTDVAVLLGVVDGTELHGTLAGADVSLEDGGLALALGLLSLNTINRYNTIQS